MLAKRIIPCLDIKDGRVVKGVNFVNLRDAGDPVEQARLYDEQGEDELVFLDISATHEGRKTTLELVSRVAETVFMPLTVGGGIREVDDMRNLLLAGADKVSVNSAAVKRPELLSEGAARFGAQCIVLAIDARRNGSSWEVYVAGGRTPTGIDAVEWATRGVELGAGEILLTSMDHDGSKNGFAIELTKAVSELVGIRLFGVRQDTLLGVLGMENGDRLQTINGFDMASPEKALEAYARLRTADKLTISINRRGQNMNLDYNIK